MTRENEVRGLSGWLMLLVIIAVAVGIAYLFITGVLAEDPWQIVPGAVLALLWFVGLFGFFIVEPNGSKVLLLFGKYVGTVKDNGFYWANPLYTKRAISLRARTLNGEKLKVNDHTGNPVEIAAIVVWQVKDTYNASFVVDSYEQYVALQSETSVRHLASSYAYDAEDEAISLRRNTEEVSVHLLDELKERLDRAGVTVLEARLSHLAYAPEIAGAMLRRQQAAAIIAARQRIVDGAVGMVDMALQHLNERKIIILEDERKAAMVSNLLVVLCSEQAAQPVLNAGTLHP